MQLLGLDLTDWTAISAIGTLVLAGATIIAVIATVLVAGSDRRRDDRLRREADEKWERRFRAEQRDREDGEARQVTTEISRMAGQNLGMPGASVSYVIVVSAPVTYPVKHVNIQLAREFPHGGIEILPVSHVSEHQEARDGRAFYRFTAAVPKDLDQPLVITRFADRHDHIYYGFMHQTWRFPDGTHWPSAAREIYAWVAAGPNRTSGLLKEPAAQESGETGVGRVGPRWRFIFAGRRKGAGRPD